MSMYVAIGYWVESNQTVTRVFTSTSASHHGAKQHHQAFHFRSLHGCHHLGGKSHKGADRCGKKPSDLDGAIRFGLELINLE